MPRQSIIICCTDWINGRDRQRCFRLILAIFSSLQDCNRTLKIRSGYSQLRKVLQSPATLPLLGGVTALFLIAIVGGIHELDIFKYMVFAVPSLSVMLLVMATILKLSLWRAPRKLTPAEAQELIQGQPGMIGLTTHQA